MKKLLAISLLAFLGLATHAAAQGFVPIAPIPDLTSGVTANSAELATFFNNLYKYLIGFAAMLAFIEIVWGGLEYSTQDSVSQKSDGKQRIYNAIGGLILVLSPVLVFSIINPSILNLSLSLPELKTTSGTPAGTGGVGITDSTSECTGSGTSGILQVAVCPSDTAATKWGQNCTNGNLSITKKTNPANGVVISTVTCTGKQSYVFIDKKGILTFTINALQPLVSVPDRPNNGSDAMNFASICKNANVGFQTCVSDLPGLTRSVPCQLTGANAATTWKCYNQKLTCEDVFALGKCSTSPSWTPFQ